MPGKKKLLNDYIVEPEQYMGFVFLGTNKVIDGPGYIKLHKDLAFYVI